MASERLEALAGALLLRLPETLISRLLGDALVVDGCRLDRRTQLLLDLQKRSGQPGFGEMTVSEARAMLERASTGLGPGARYMASIVNRRVPGPGGDLPIRVYAPMVNPRGLPAIVYFHGGGWVVGSLESHDEVCRALADRVQCIVVSVDYRLAPENKFPAAADDAVAAFAWLTEHAPELGIDPARIAVAGDSAGGNLAAGVAQWARSAAQPPCFQLLIYPVTDVGADSGSYSTFADGFFLTRAGMHWFRDHYLTSESERMDPRVSPLRADDLAGVAPAFVATAGFDPLRDEGHAYAKRLAEAGVPVWSRCYDTTIHGCFSLCGVLPGGRLMFEDAVGALRLAFARV